MWVIVRQGDWVGGNDDVLAIVGPFATEAQGRAAMERMLADLPTPPFRHERLSLIHGAPG
ncbi:hypothetical protein [Modestobacter sp. SYSU DS0511]